jgi:hypothetical protein
MLRIAIGEVMHLNISYSKLLTFQGNKLIGRLMLTLTTRNHITCWKKGAIARVARVVEVFEFEVWGQFEGQHLQATLKKKTTIKYKLYTSTNVHNKPTKARGHPKQLKLTS